jgi:hypothetical protein
MPAEVRPDNRTQDEISLWEAVELKDFAKIGGLVTSNHTLVNSLHPDPKNGRNLAIHLIQSTKNTANKPRELLTLVLTRKELNWEFKQRENTAVSALFDALSADKDRVLPHIQPKLAMR